MICVMKSSLKIFKMFPTLLFFFKQKIYFILGDIFFKIPKNLILGIFFFFFFCEADTKKHRYAPAQTSNTTLVKLTD